MPEQTEVELKRGDRLPETYLSISQIAAYDGRTRETISKRLDEGGVQPCGKRGGWPVYSLRDVWRVVLRGGTAGGGEDPDKLDPHSRHAHYRAEQAKRALEVEARTLHRNDDCEAETARRDKLVAMALDTIPDILERDCGCTPAQVAVVEAHIDKLRTALADELQAPAVAPLDTPA